MTTQTNTATNRTATQKAAFAIACKYQSAGRVYFIDIDTKEEVCLGDNNSGLPSQGASECGIRDGKRHTDTVLAVSVTCFATKIVRSVTASDFPGRRIAVKTWHPNGHWKGQAANDRNVEWQFLADTRNGWQGNEADNGNITRTTLGKAARAEIAR